MIKTNDKCFAKTVSTNIMICHNRGNIVITFSIHFKRFLKKGAPKNDLVVCLKVKEALFETNGMALSSWARSRTS